MSGSNNGVVSTTEQRLRSCSRRAFLGGIGAIGLGGAAGCVGSGRESGGGDGSEGGSGPVTILAAGSLQNPLANGLEPALDVPVRIESHGSATVARLVAERKRDPDIVSVADTALFDDPLSPPWHATFTSNAVVIAYNPDTEGGKRVVDAGAERWYEPLMNGDVRLGRTDPDHDPLGYRTLFMLELASRYYDGASNLGEEILKRDQIYPETALISQFETGAIDAAIAYRSMAIERDYEYIALPDRIDLSNPSHEEAWYSTVSYSLPTGHEIEGGPISYGSTIRNAGDAALSVFAAQSTGTYLDEHGFVSRGEFPAYAGNVPQRVKRATDRPSESQSRRKARSAESSSAVIADSAGPI